MIFFKNIVIFIVLARIALNYSKLSLNSELEAIQLENCLWKTYKNFLKPINSIVFLQFNISDVIILRKLHKEQKFMIQIKLFLDDSLILESLPKTSSYFIQFNKENDIIMLFDNLQMKLFNYRAKINFISTTIFENPLNIFAFISNFTANLNIFNVNIYLRNESSSCSLKWIVFKQENRMDEIRVVLLKDRQYLFEIQKTTVYLASIIKFWKHLQKLQICPFRSKKRESGVPSLMVPQLVLYRNYKMGNTILPLEDIY